MYFNRAIAKEKVNANEKLMNIPQCSVHKKACSALCTNPKCKQPNRLCCINCILKDHKDDTNFMIPLDEIDNQTIDTPLPFSKASQCDSIQNLIQKIKQLGSEEQVASIFDKINLRQTQQVTQIKEYFTTKYKQTKNLRDQNLHILEEQFLKLNNLKQIKEYVSALTSQKISEEQFNQSVSQIINQDNTDEQQSAYNDILQIIQSDNFSKQILFDPAVWEEYHNKSEKLLQEYFQRCQNFRIEEFTGFKLVPIPTFKDANKLAFLTEGIEVQMGGHCAVMSSIPLKQGQYKFTLEMKQYSGGCIVFGIESENKISGSNLWGGSPACCITCNRQDTVGFYLVQGQNYLGANIPQNAQYEVTICLKSSLFRIKRNDLDSTMECAQDNLPIGVYRFFLNNYSGQMCQFKLTAMNYSD